MDILKPRPLEGLAAQPRAPGAGLRDRLRAAALHLLISAAIAAGVVALVYLRWYPAPLDRLTGVGHVLVLLLAVDVVLGPLMTLVVFDRRKRSLPWDLAIIGGLQLAALGYGLHTVEAGRPHYLVFVLDRFEVVSRADLAPDDIAAGASNPAAATSLSGPVVVSAELFADPKRRQEMLMESVRGGRDLQHFPSQYRPIADGYPDLRARGHAIAELRRLNPVRASAIDAAIDRTGLAEAALRFVPVKGPEGDAAMLVDAGNGHLLGLVDARPWD